MDTDNPYEKMLDWLREKGWCQGAYGSPEGPNCIVGAAIYTGVLEPELGTANWGKAAITLPLMHIIAEQYEPLGITVFNDMCNTTFKDVERVLEKAAVKWEEERVVRHD